jgi:hypothetical protein
MSIHEQDRALGAVRRVRTAREQDSRIGLQVALATSRQRRREAERANARLVQAPRFGVGSLTEFHGHVLHVTALAQAELLAADRAESSRAVAQEATVRWQRDRTALRVVDLLLERRAEERADERDRREARELDDLAAQGWLRAEAGGGR